MPTFGSLFAGIEGLGLGLERAGWEGRWYSEIDPYCIRVHEKHWPDMPNLGDVTLVEWEKVERVDLVCGGYPCPAFSQAARGRNVAPDLWPHMRDAIAVLRPRFVLLENVAAHLGRGFPAVLADLHALGFDAEWATLTACAFGASHTRRRLFVVAYPHGCCESVFPVDAEVAWPSAPSGDRRHWGVPTADDARADDGVPYRLDRARVLGNAVVPQVAEWLGRQLLEVVSVGEGVVNDDRILSAEEVDLLVRRLHSQHHDLSQEAYYTPSEHPTWDATADAATAIEALGARLADTGAERDALQASLTEVDLVWVPRIADAEARAERAEAALRKYGEHHTTCDAWPYDEWQMNEGPCTCGLDEAARAALGEQEPLTGDCETDCHERCMHPGFSECTLGGNDE